MSVVAHALGAPRRESTILLGSNTFIPALLAFLILYHLVAPRYSTEKQLSWIITASASAMMTLSSIPFVLDFLLDGGSINNVRESPIFSYTMNRVFQAYLIADLIMGAAHYRSQMALLTGWIHHAAYVLIVQVAIKRSWTQIFCLCAAMELPTFILAIGSINPYLRSDRLFAASFFTTRILFHIILIMSYLFPEYAPGDTRVPGYILMCIFPLHAWWFTGCIKGFIRRAKAKNSNVEPNVIALDISQASLHVGVRRPSPPSPKRGLQVRRTSMHASGQTIPTLRLNVLDQEEVEVESKVEGDEWMNSRL